MRTDSILEVDVLEVGRRCIHVEFQYVADATDIEPRLVEYWARLRTRYGSPPEQHVVVVNRSGGRLKGLFRSGGLVLTYTAHHVWEMPSSDLIRLDGLYPLAVIGLTDDREQVFLDVAHRARSEGVQADRVLKNAVTLANLYLPTRTLELLLRRTDMPNELRELPMVQEFLEEGRQEGRQEASAARSRDLVAVASEKFGPLPEALAELMLDPSREFASIARAVMRAATVEELQTALG